MPDGKEERKKGKKKIEGKEERKERKEKMERGIEKKKKCKEARNIERGMGKRDGKTAEKMQKRRRKKLIKIPKKGKKKRTMSSRVEKTKRKRRESLLTDPMEEVERRGYACSDCDAIFTRSGNLSNHMKMHAKEREKCDEATAQSPADPQEVQEAESPPTERAIPQSFSEINLKLATLKENVPKSNF